MNVWIVVLAVVAGAAADTDLTQDGMSQIFRKVLFKEPLESAEATALQDIAGYLKTKEVSPRSLPFRVTARMNIDCLICRSAFAAFFEAVREGQTDEQLSSTVASLCTVLGIETAGICSGAVSLNIPILAYIVRTTPEASIEAFCGLIQQNANSHEDCPWNDPRFEWTVELPDETEGVIPITSEQPLKIALITDAHIDPLYEPYGAADCGEPTCCRKGQTPRTRYGSRQAEPAGYWGDYRNCDTPIWAFENVIDEIVDKNHDIDVVYYIGDTIDHHVWETSYELIKDSNLVVVDKVRGSFGEHVPAFMAIGNHESQPTNQFAPSSVTAEKINTTWLYDSLAEKWGVYLDETASNDLRERGDFSMLVRPGLRVISINSNIAYKYNWWLVYDPLDAKRHLDWLVSKLHEAEQAGERVHILSHIPPGVHDLTYTWTREYNRIVQRFRSTIAAEFNGHTHADEFKVFFNSEGEATNVAWNGGGTTAYSNYNLNYKILTVDPQTYQLSQMETYVYNLTEANLTPNRPPHWFQLYDLRQRFRLNDLSAPSIADLINRMVTTDRQLLDLYAAFLSSLSDARWPYCNDWCKVNELCKAVVTVLWERERCNQLQSDFWRSRG